MTRYNIKKRTSQYTEDDFIFVWKIQSFCDKATSNKQCVSYLIAYFFISAWPCYDLISHLYSSIYLLFAYEVFSLKLSKRYFLQIRDDHQFVIYVLRHDDSFWSLTVTLAIELNIYIPQKLNCINNDKFVLIW